MHPLLQNTFSVSSDYHGNIDSEAVFFSCPCREKPRQEHPSADPRQSQRPARSSREDTRPHQQPRGQEPNRIKEPNWLGGPAAPAQHRERDREPRDHHDQVVRREGANDRRPKSSYTGGDSSPQSPREKRPLSGPNIRTPNLPVTEGVIKTAQQTGRPFNTYPRAESDSGRSPSGQVHRNQTKYTAVFLEYEQL